MTTTLTRPDEKSPAAVRRAMIDRLSKQSVEKRFEAFADITWDDPDFAVRTDDPRWTLWDFDPLGSTNWYRSLPQADQAKIGLYRIAACMKVGQQFENWLQAGLLINAENLDNGDTAFRYIHHEISEESQHSMMFQEFVNRTGLPVRGMPRSIRMLRPFAMWCAKHAPALFFVMVLGGEDPIDHIQRHQLSGENTHPLAERIMRIHVTEEARHLSFARHTLKTIVPELGPVERQVVALIAPAILGIMVRLMVVPQADLIRHCDIPKDVMREANRSEEGRRLLIDAVAKPRKLCRELGLVTLASKTVWKIAKIWDEDTNTGSSHAA